MADEQPEVEEQRRGGVIGSIRGGLQPDPTKAGFFTKRRSLFEYALWFGGIYGIYRLYLYFFPS